MVVGPAERVIEDDLFSALPLKGSARFLNLVGFCERNHQRLLAGLPSIAAEIGGNDGFAVMLSFISRWSGTRFYVPRGHAQFIAKAMEPISPRTHRYFLRSSNPSALLDIPSAWGVFLAIRRIAIEAALADCDDHALVARRFGVTMRSLRKLSE